jgi:hypothetical protein
LELDPYRHHHPARIRAEPEKSLGGVGLVQEFKFDEKRRAVRSQGARVAFDQAIDIGRAHSERFVDSEIALSVASNPDAQFSVHRIFTRERDRTPSGTPARASARRQIVESRLQDSQRAIALGSRRPGRAGLNSGWRAHFASRLIEIFSISRLTVRDQVPVARTVILSAYAFRVGRADRRIAVDGSAAES